MKRVILIICFISITLALTLLNVNLRKDSTNIDIKIQNIEALEITRMEETIMQSSGWSMYDI